MQNADCPETIFDEANRLHEEGMSEAAARWMIQIICHHPDLQVRERAGRLFARFVGRHPAPSPEAETAPEELTRPDEPPAQPSRPRASEGREDVVPDKRLAPFDARRASKARRLVETARIAPNAKLPSPLGQHLLTFLQLSFGNCFDLPDPMMAALQAVEDRALHLRAGTSQTDVCLILRSVREQFPDSPVIAEVFGALVSIFYANGFLDAEHAREVTSASPCFVQGRTLRELLQADE